MRKQFGWVTLAVLVLGLVLAPAASATPNRINGTWLAESGADQGQTIFNFHFGRTLTVSSSLAGLGTGQGEWKRVGARSYIARNTAFIYGADGEAELFLQVDSEIEVDGDTFSANFTSTVSLLDGTVIDVSNGTGTAVRIGLD